MIVIEYECAGFLVGNISNRDYLKADGLCFTAECVGTFFGTDAENKVDSRLCVFGSDFALAVVLEALNNCLQLLGIKASQTANSCVVIAFFHEEGQGQLLCL